MRCSGLALVALTIAAGTASAGPAEPVVVEDFESGAGRWYAVEGKRPEGVKALVTLTPSAEAKLGDGAGRLRFVALPGTWAHVQMNVAASEWTGAGADRIRFWLKGDGSGETLNVMFGNYEHKPPLCFRAPVRLDFTGWREVTLPFSSFAPEGLAGSLRNIVLIQLNASNTSKSIDVTLDEITVLPAEGTGTPGRFQDLDVPARGTWDTPSPAAPVVVDCLAGIPASVVLPRTIHGMRNHKDLHNPVEFEADYAEAGTFAVQIGDTSGHGGSRLILHLDGKEVLRRDFPGETQTALKQYQGWYSIPVPAGKHRIRVDNDGADWYTVETYRFANYGAAGVRLRREDGALEVRFARPEDAAGVELQARIAGRPLSFRAEAAGLFVALPPKTRFGAGVYPVTVTASRGGKTLLRREAKMTLRTPRLRGIQVAYPVDEPVTLKVRYANAADVPVAGRRLTAQFGKRTLSLADGGDGTYTAPLGRLPAGVYEARVSVDGVAREPVKLVVYDPEARPWTREGIIRLGPNGTFRTAEGCPHVPWGFATIGVFVPDPERIQGPAGPRAWCRADDTTVREWIAMLRAYGINCVRFGVNVGSGDIGGDQGGRLDPYIGQRLRRFLDIIGPLGVRAVPVMWWGHYRNFGFQGIPAYDALIRTQADWFTNAQALALQKQYVREVVEPLKDDPRILAWEVMNETYRAGGDLHAAVRWTNEILDTIREAGAKQLTTTSAAEATPGPEVQWIRGTRLDFFNWHAYPTYPDYGSWRKEAGEDAPREIGAYAATIALSQRLGGKVSILGETGNDRGREVSYPEYRALITRDCLWIAFLCGSPGGISWDAIADPREFEVISRLAGRVDWNAFQPAAAPVAVRARDLVKDLGALARYAAWSLRSGVPVRFIGADETPAPGQVVAEAPFAEPKVPASAAPLRVSEGYESMCLASADGKVLLGYARNAGEVLPQNVRTRTPRDLRLTLRLPRPADVEVWDLDTRQCVRQYAGQKEVAFAAAATDHDYALFAQAK